MQIGQVLRGEFQQMPGAGQTHQKHWRIRVGAGAAGACANAARGAGQGLRALRIGCTFQACADK
jgi:hypothetical protein